ncbi:MAG: 5-formyltetrahydrofolate cyclo-ligase [Peptostreptococcaceae bacterium]|nr:5-formyltetrahydrofolate cyclo-ligase [Peptostreptococcaceae bacterium]
MKKTLRNSILSQRDAMSGEDNKRLSGTICRSLIALSAYNEAKTVMCFLSFRSEVNTSLIVKNILGSGKKLIVPVTDIKTKTLKLSYVKSMDDLVKSTYGILEPSPSAFKEASPKDIDLVLVPGACFNLKGYRIGYGGGYYDKFLPQIRKDALALGLCYDFQIVSSIYPEKHDIPVDIVLSEKRMIKTKMLPL